MTEPNISLPTSKDGNRKANAKIFADISASEINAQLNDLFRKRLENVQEKNPNALEATLIIYEEWIETLLRTTQLGIKHTEAIEEMILTKLKPFPTLIPTNADEIAAECQKCRRDIERLIDCIQRAFRHADFNLNDLKLNSTEILLVPPNE